MSKPVTEVIELETPIKREGGNIEKLTLRKPVSGELRGLSLADLINMEVDSITKVLPRISNPTLTEQDVREMDPADLSDCGRQIADFLLPKRLKG